MRRFNFRWYRRTYSRLRWCAFPVIKHTTQIPLAVRQIFQEDSLDEHVKGFGFPPREPVVFVEVHCETVDHLLALMQDAGVRKVAEKGHEFGLQSNGYAFAADVIAKHDNPAPQDGAHLICVYNVPPHISTQEHDQKFEDFIDNFLAVPAVKKNFVRFEMWQHNNMLDDDIRAFGYSASGPAFIHHAIVENWDSALEMMEDPEARQFVINAGNSGKDFNLKTDGYVFHGRVVTKIDKPV